MSDDVTPALDRLFDLARSDTGQARRVANFLLAWWDAQLFGGFDLTDLFAVDRAIADDMASVFGFLGRHTGAIYADGLGYGDRMEELIRLWRTPAEGEASRP